MTRTDLIFTSGGTRMSGWFYPAASAADALAPVVVMAHGLGGTKDSGLEPFAERFAAAGLNVLLFDYRGFGASEGVPRQRVSLDGQVEDYRAACVAATAQPGVDPNRIVLWGVSQSGGHVIKVAADRDDVAAVIAVVPMVNGMAAARHALPLHKPSALLRSTATGLLSSVRQLAGGAPSMIPLVGQPGELAALTADGYEEAYRAVAGPTWRNEVDASIGSELGRYRADKAASRIKAPALFQIADFDQAAPPHAAAKAAFDARAEVRHYPCDHFDIFEGRDWFEAAVEHQLFFLKNHGLLGRVIQSNDVPATS
ncbi:alpha/beta hydrolase [Gordonia sp. (in: high G+C Gram-positive bacteria)]|uniref:alpha/beta hydrolase n=1 Tax=Gordonia sp. (in: high G+C Gram-positive bacteria) TaxID=84139 RepID=UPI003C75FFE1